MANWTKKRARQGSRRRLDRIEGSLLELAYNWGDLDQYVVDLVDAVVNQLNEIRESMDESVQEEEEIVRGDLD